MRQMRRLSGLGVLAAFVLAAQSALAAEPLIAHRASYDLTLDGSKPTIKLDNATGRIDYEIAGDACRGYDVKMRQGNVVDTGEGTVVASEMVSTSWEDGAGTSYKFQTVSSADGRVRSDVAGVVTRTANGLAIDVSKPRRESLSLKGDILMPTQHVTKVIEAADKGESLLEARVFDGSDDGSKAYDTLAVIGRGAVGAPNLPEGARAVLDGQTYYPVTVSYFEAGETGQEPAYVMSMTLYRNGVIGELKIDYNDFALKGRISSLDLLKASEGCKK